MSHTLAFAGDNLGEPPSSVYTNRGPLWAKRKTASAGPQGLSVGVQAFHVPGSVFSPAPIKPWMEPRAGQDKRGAQADRKPSDAPEPFTPGVSSNSSPGGEPRRAASVKLTARPPHTWQPGVGRLQPGGAGRFRRWLGSIPFGPSGNQVFSQEIPAPPITGLPQAWVTHTHTPTRLHSVPNHTRAPGPSS